MRRIAVLALLMLFWSGLACRAQAAHDSAQSSAEKNRPASDAHSFQELFQKLEREWTVAVQQQNKDTLDAILAPEFMYWTSEHPDTPTLRDAWLRHALAHGEAGHVSAGEMFIRAFVGSALVSFELTRDDAGGGTHHVEHYFIVDLWVVNHGKWQVADRYTATAGRPPCRAN